ncbi:2-oxo acid dehydrogenase subunit E2 [archaeon AH-315-M20]|nr:2-oxo acid dehydrogenase subunit E2 [archaeon AH-315-M20]
MAYEFKFPDVGEGITEGTIVKWKVREGGKVESDQVLAEVETDKAVVEIPSPKKGTILKLYHKEGDTIYVGEVLAVIGQKGEKVPKKKERYTGSVVGFVPEAEEEKPKLAKKTVSKPEEAKIIAAPVVRKFAKQLDVDLTQVTGTGPSGRITEDDVKASVGIAKKAISKKPVAKVTKKYDMFGYIDRIPLKGIKKITAKKMIEAVSNAALVTHHDHVDVTKLAVLRKKEKEKAAKKGIHLTYLPFIIKATIEAIKKHPYVASSVEEDEIIVKKYYNVGVAIDTPEGLIVPVIKGADQKKLYDLAKEIESYVEKAKTRKIDLMDLKGGVFTITNIGVIGSTYFTPIINYPETCILGTGRIEDQARVVDGQVVVRKVMPISFTYDHRVLDGAEAARFMNDLRVLLENPKSLVN